MSKMQEGQTDFFADNVVTKEGNGPLIEGKENAKKAPEL